MSTVLSANNPGLAAYMTTNYANEGAASSSQAQQQQATSAGQQTGSQQQQNMYNPTQQGLQSGLGMLYNQLLQGNIPSSFTNPAAPMAAYNANFTNTLMPQYAAQYGAGSPVGLSQQALGMQQLQGSLYNTGVNNFLNALGGGNNYAFNSIGQSGTQAGNTSTTNQGSQTGTSLDNTSSSGYNQSMINPLLLLLSGGASGVGNYLSGTP